MVKQKQSNEQLLNVNLRVFVKIGLVFLLFYPPFLRGLFFAPELLMTHMFTATLFALCWYDKIVRRDVSFIKGYLDYSALALVIVYALSIFGAVNMRGAIGEFLKVINYFMVYWITSQTVKSEKDIRTIYKAIYFSAVGVALVGIGAATGYINYPGAIVQNRIYSTFQYPNTMAIFMALASFLGLVLINSTQKKASKTLYIIGLTFLMAVLVSSQSRGSWFLYPFVTLFFFLGLPKGSRFTPFYNLVISLGVGLQIARVIEKHLLSGATQTGLKYIIFGMVFVAVAQWAYELVIKWMDNRDVTPRIRKLVGAGVVAYALVVGVVYVIYTAQAVPSVAASFVPSDALKRAQTINNQATSYTARLDLSKTAFIMALDYPFNGLGGEGWNALYHRYQPNLTYSSETHNYPAKVLVETGFIGLLILVGIWVLWCQKTYKLWRSEIEDETWVLIWGGAVAALILMLHSVFDFDLSMGAMGIILWCLWGVVAGASRNFVDDVKYPIGTPRAMMVGFMVGTISAALLFIPAISFYKAGTYGADGVKAMQKKNWILSEYLFLKATSLDPFTANYAADLCQVYTIKGMASNDSNQIALAQEYSSRAVKMEPYNYEVRTRLLIVNILSGRVDNAVQDAESLVANNPLDVHNFEILGKVYITAGRHLYNGGQKNKARAYWEKTLEMEKIMTEKIHEQVKPQLTALLYLYQGEGAFLIGDYNRAVDLLNRAAEKKTTLPDLVRTEAIMYLNAAKDKSGLDVNDEEISRLFKTNPQLEQEFNKLLQIKL